MPQRARTAKTSAASLMSPSEPKKNSVPIRKITRSAVIKKSSPIKRHLEQTSTSITQPRKKRLSSLTAATLLQYCTSILSPSRKVKSKPEKTKPITEEKPIPSTTSRKRPISNNKLPPTESNIPIRTRREASSHASAMILQQNEIERSRYKYEHSTAVIRRRTITTKVDIPPEPSIVNESKYPSLTEAILAEHNRLHEKIPLKHDNLIKWTEELALCGRLSPPYSKHEIPPESIENNSIEQHSNPKETSTSSIIDSNPSITNNISTPNFLFPSSAYPLDLRSFYSLLPCWQYPTWPFQSLINQKTSLTNLQTKTKKSTTFDSNKHSIVPIHQREQEILLSSSKTEPLTLHLHTHHHHHIHKANSSSLLKSSNSTKVLSSLEKPSIPVNQEQPVETKTILPLGVNNTEQKEDQQTTENEVLNLSINNKTSLNQQNGIIKKTTRRKSSPVKRHVNGETKSNSSPSPLISSEVPHTINSLITSPRKIIDDNQVIDIPSLSNDITSNGNFSLGDRKSPRRVLKRRSVSAAVPSSTTIISITDKSLRGKRTTSASNIPTRLKPSTNKKRLHSSASLTLPLSTKNPNQRKKQKVTHYWVLFGKSEQKLVAIHTDQLPVFRKCYSSIRHVTEKDVIKSNDCVILRPDTDKKHDTTPYLAKVKWFWEEPTTGEIQMSLIWYYHPEHAELSAHVKERFLPNEVLASRYFDCVNTACIEDKCYVLNFNEYNRYCLREKSVNLFDHSESVGQLKFLLNKNTPTIHHRPLPAKTVGNQNIFFCRYVYDYRVKRILKNPSVNNPIMITTASSL